MSPYIIFFGIILLAFGILLIALDAWKKMETTSEHGNHTEIKGGAVIMLGPIPIIFGSDRKFAILAILLAIILTVLLIVFTLQVH